MKKTLIALAALAALGSASAQVTLYGKVDVGLSNSTTSGQANAYFGDKAPSAPIDQGAQFTGNNYETSRFGIKGGTDLAGGTKAIFQLEQGFDAANGADKLNNLTFNRVSMVGVTGSFGTVSAGLQWSPYDSAWGWDALEYNGFSAANKAFYSGIHGDNGTGGFGNVKNSIQYTTPDFSGFNASIIYANGADKTNPVPASTTWSPDPTTGVPVPKLNPAIDAQDATKYIGVGANYVAGPLSINFGYESVPTSKQFAQITYASGASLKTLQGNKTAAWLLGASYNLSVATVSAAFEGASADMGGLTAKDAGYALGVSVPVSGQTSFAASYAYEKTAAEGLSDGTAKAFGAQVLYNWTKQAVVYAGVVQAKTVQLTDTAEVTATTYATGVRYNF